MQIQNPDAETIPVLLVPGLGRGHVLHAAGAVVAVYLVAHTEPTPARYNVAVTEGMFSMQPGQ